MSGIELYTLYVKAFAEQNTSVDSWEELPEGDREVWNDIASQVSWL